MEAKSGLEPALTPAWAGFTVLELLIVIALVAILAVLAAAGFSGLRTASFKATDINNLRQIGMACQSFAGDHLGCYPLKYNFDNGVPAPQRYWDGALIAGGYLTKEAFVSPADHIERTVNGDKRSYKYNGYFGDSKKEQASTVEGNIRIVTKPLSDIILAGDGAGPQSMIGSSASSGAYQHQNCTTFYDGKGANFVFLDLHAAWMTDSGGYDDADKTLWYKHWRPDLPN